MIPTTVPSPAVLAALCAVFLAACAATRDDPVLYPNARFNQAGQAQAAADVEACKAAALQAGIPEVENNAAARGAIGGGLVGGLGTAVVGAVLGHNTMRNVAAGAAGGAAVGAVRGGMRDTDGNPIFRNFVARCLHEKGYEIIGWQ